ncbi:TIGR03086 family metal-binding protein [Streptomyces sp. NPDC047917]|uniref:TIGR03086 family metal-binding protein n=1 Tax=Streptomyces sp. NPDC047917 TaxID=3365491 RepID=UPI00371A4A01
MASVSVSERHGEALRLFTDRVQAVREDQWSAPTPCAGWAVRDLVAHLTSEQLWVPPLVTGGRTVAEAGCAFAGDVLGEDPVAAWDRAAAGARGAFEAPEALERTVDLSYGDTAADAARSHVGGGK